MPDFSSLPPINQAVVVAGGDRAYVKPPFGARFLAALHGFACARTMMLVLLPSMQSWTLHEFDLLKGICDFETSCRGVGHTSLWQLELYTLEITPLVCLEGDRVHSQKFNGLINGYNAVAQGWLKPQGWCAALRDLSSTSEQPDGASTGMAWRIAVALPFAGP